MSNETVVEYFVNEWGSIEALEGGLLYEPEGLEGLAPNVRQRLADIHTYYPDIDWLGAREMLIKEGLIYRDADEGE